jgi:hypothetical protein
VNEELRAKCLEDGCGWHGKMSELLWAEHPFRTSRRVYGCPRCEELEVAQCCEEPDCWEASEHGMASPGGVVWVCSKHLISRSKQRPTTDAGTPPQAGSKT